MSVDETPGQESLVQDSRCGGGHPSNCPIINRVHEPRTLWIGCSDARVPESVMLRSTWICRRCALPGCQCPVHPPRCQCPVHQPDCQCSVHPPRCQCPVHMPGCQYQTPPCVFPPEQIFVQRNIANQFHLTDSNAVSVLTYGVTGIKDNPVKEIRVVGHTNCGGVEACFYAVRPEPRPKLPDVLWTWLGPLRELASRHMEDSIDELAVRNVREQVKNVKEVLRRLQNPSEVRVSGYLYNVEYGTLVQVPESGN